MILRLFALGDLRASTGAAQRIPAEDMLRGLRRHACADWGDLDREDSDANNRAVTEGTRILSAYTATNGERFWIITEADRSATTVILPEDY